MHDLPPSLVVAAAETQAPTAAPLAGPPLVGEPSARKRFVIWGSLTCPYTAQAVKILLGILKDMPKAVAIEWRHFPIHPPDPVFHLAVLSAPADKRWLVIADILGIVDKGEGDYSKLTQDALSKIVVKSGGSKEALDAAMNDPAKWALLKSDLIAAKLMGVTRTPGLFIDGYFLTPAGIPTDAAGFDKSLRAMIKLK
jgi:protein-disulfide isomerase